MSKRQTNTTYLSIHSKDRDVSLYPQRGSFRINLMDQCNVKFTDIVSVSLYTAILPTIENITKEPYLLLEVDELSGAAFKASNLNASEAFALIQLDRPITEPGFINAKMDSCRHVQLQGNALGLHVLNSLTIKVKNQNGELFGFGSDSVGSIDLSKQITLIFEVKHLVNVREE